MPGPSVGTALWRNWREYRHSRAAETFEVSLYSDADVIGWVQRPGWPVDLIPAMTDPAYPGLRFALVARIRWCPEPTPVAACFARPAARAAALRAGCGDFGPLGRFLPHGLPLFLR